MTTFLENSLKKILLPKNNLLYYIKLNLMKRYGLFIKNSNEVINNIPSRNLEEAKQFFISQKQLSEEKFDQLFEVRLIS